MTLRTRLRLLATLIVLGLAAVLLVVARVGTTARMPAPAPTDREAAGAPATPGPPTCSAYAAITGSDSASGTEHRPFRTVARLLRSLAPDKTGCLQTGIYHGDVRLTTSHTTLRSAPGQRATLAVGTLTIPPDVRDATVSDLIVIGAQDKVTVRATGDGFTLERNEISNDNTGDSCVLVGASDHRTTGGTVRGNVIHGCGRPGSHLDHGVYAQNVGPAPAAAAGLVIEDNVLFDIAGYAIQLYPRTVQVVVRRNVIDGGGLSVRGGIVIDGPLARGHLIEDNVILDAATAAVVQRTGSGHVSQDNCFWGNDGDVTGSGITSKDDLDSSTCWLSLPPWARGNGDRSLGGRW
jgi:hypothetical protein